MTDPGGLHAMAVDDAKQALQRDYDLLRAKLETLLAQPVKNMAEVDRLVDELERTQLRLKGALGIQGNNPNE
jgi:hypothetical protein